MSHCKDCVDSVISQLDGKLFFGQRDILKFGMIAFLCRGHLLLEGPPGTGKTIAAGLLARLLVLSFKRIQFTSDLLPGDILGASLYDPSSASFRFIPGPIFSDIVLADEVNRTPPRTQSALLEAMEERQVSIEGETHKLSEQFFVVATQNPREFEGTFPLPEAQLDRFLFQLKLTPLPSEVERAMLEAVLRGELPPDFGKLKAVVCDFSQIEREAGLVVVDPSILKYISEIVAATRNHPGLEWGSSFRGAMALARTSRILALLEGRNYVTADDVQQLVNVALRHRIKLSPEALVNNASTDAVLADIVSSVPFPV